MTGYGEGVAAGNGWSVEIKIKSLNHKYIDLYIKGLEEFESVELNVREFLKSRFSRGRVEISFTLQPDSSVSYELDPVPAEKYYVALKALADRLKLDHPITLDHLSRLPGAIKPLPTETGDLWPIIEDALGKAVAATLEMRRKEGEALGFELLDLINALDRELKAVEEIVPTLKEQYRQRLQERINELQTGIEFDPERLEQEVVIWAERSDITEEIARLKIHLQAFRDNINSTEPSGRSLDFLAQEMNREVNTMAAKTRDGQISQRFVEMKTHIERVREQVRNVE